MRVGGRLAREVARVELLEGGFEVVDIEQDVGRDLIVGVDLDDVETSLSNGSGAVAEDKYSWMRTKRSPRVAMTVDVMFSAAELGDGPHVPRFRRLDRVERQRSRPDGDRR